MNDAVNFKGGLFLIPLGILNETHEPPTYYGVMRNQVETRIIPTTWRELGAGVHGIVCEGVRYDVGITTNFDSGKLDDPTTGIRSAHQEGELANARNLAVYGALNYRCPGLLVGGGVFTGDTGQKGAYVQAAYHVYKHGNFDVAPFIRYERVDIRQAEDPGNNLLENPNNNERIKTLGVNFWLHPQVVLKADIQRYATDKSQDRFDLGLGFMF